MITTVAFVLCRRDVLFKTHTRQTDATRTIERDIFEFLTNYKFPFHLKDDYVTIHTHSFFYLSDLNPCIWLLTTVPNFMWRKTKEKPIKIISSNFRCVGNTLLLPKNLFACFVHTNTKCEQLHLFNKIEKRMQWIKIDQKHAHDAHGVDGFIFFASSFSYSFLCWSFCAFTLSLFSIFECHAGMEFQWSIFFVVDIELEKRCLTINLYESHKLPNVVFKFFGVETN